ncbi:hypothetical protein RFI_28960 [Reticulomyxa filosa]|uniref:Uncharacterized protein n=1 Tax=Reticulomyxa filosa TaxID=46433 RepID=X6M388_RETFI|nr:hypothetical protein RFI_28960 [Reticulomyxa filosa]|eukprot:ETO08428.1 hypothetical protein RFI_28960 [Reticulomyxa filosa]
MAKAATIQAILTGNGDSEKLKTGKKVTKVKKKSQKRKYCDIKTCETIYNWLISADRIKPKLKNGVDYLLVTEPNKRIELESDKWHHFKFGIYLLGEKTTLTVRQDSDDLGHLKIKTSHLWIGKECRISCNGLGYKKDSGTGKGQSASKHFQTGGGASYGSKGRAFNFVDGGGENGAIYGDKTLLKEIHFGSGGGSAKCSSFELKGGSGGGIIEIIVEQQIINEGYIECDGLIGQRLLNMGGQRNTKGGGGSGGSILIVVQAPSHIYQNFGKIDCLGGSYCLNLNGGGRGRIAIYSRYFLLHKPLFNDFLPRHWSGSIPKEEFIMQRSAS